MVDSLLVILLTRPVVQRELIRDEAIQECVDLVHNGSIGGSGPASMIQNGETYKICPLGGYLSFDAINTNHSTNWTPHCTDRWLCHTSPWFKSRTVERMWVTWARMDEDRPGSLLGRYISMKDTQLPKPYGRYRRRGDWVRMDAN